MNRRLQRLQRRWGRFYQFSLGVILSLFLLLVGYTSVQPRSHTFQLNSVADVTVRAPKTIEDTNRTEELRQHARDRIADVRLYSAEVKNQQLDLMSQYFTFLRDLRIQEYRLVDLETAAQAQDWTEEDLAGLRTANRTANQRIYWNQLTDKERTLLYNQALPTQSVQLMGLNESLPDTAKQLWLDLDDTSFQALMTYSITLLGETLDQEIEPTHIAANVMKVRTTIVEEGRYQSYQSSLLDFMQTFIVPTMVYNQAETTRLREEAASAVQPSYILQGQIIVQEGHVIDSTVLRQLTLFGYLDASAGRFNAYAFYGLILCHLLILVSFHLPRWRSPGHKQEGLAMEMTVYSLAFAAMFACLKLLELLQMTGVTWASLALPVSLFPLLVVPKTSLRHGLVGMMFFNLMALFVVSDSFNLLESILPLAFYCLTGLIGLLMAYQAVEQRTKHSFVWQFLALFLLTTLPLLLGFNIDFFTSQGRRMVLMMLGNALLSILFYVIIWPYWEGIFNPSAELTLQRLANLNHPLLKQLIEQAPGTYHHSMMVANLSANAVEAIGGDSLLTRVASYYHDVGKTLHPLFFVENLPVGVENPHKVLNPDESARIIIGHVIEGVRILEEYDLPQSILDICWQHHGTTLVQYFYYLAKQADPSVAETAFRYSGPRPQSKEAAVIMVADSVEAASRSLKDYSQASIEALVARIIEEKREDDQFADCLLTVQELKIVQASLIQGVASMYHTRIEYPK